jgi:hypothetical protein
MPDRSWERGLHRIIETKGRLAISWRQETLARISYQRFFRNVVRGPTNRPLCRARLARDPAQPLPGWLAMPLLWWAQQAAELHHGAICRDLLKLDDSLGDMLVFSGRPE